MDASALGPKIPDRGRSVIEHDGVRDVTKLTTGGAHLGLDAHLVCEAAVVDRVEQTPKSDSLTKIRSDACHLVLHLPEHASGSAHDPRCRVVGNDPRAHHADRRVGEGVHESCQGSGCRHRVGTHERAQWFVRRGEERVDGARIAAGL